MHKVIHRVVPARCRELSKNPPALLLLLIYLRYIVSSFNEGVHIMKIEVLQEQLIAGLTIVSRAVASRAQLPVLSHILIEAKSEGLVLSATDLEIGMRVLVTAKVVEPGKACVPAKMFGEFLSSLNPGKVQLEMKGETLVLSAPGYSGKFQTISSEEFPPIAIIDGKSEICEMDALKFGESVERVVFASAKDSLRPVLTGVLWEISKAGIRLVATDGFRLAVEDLELAVKADQANLLVPSRVVMEVVRLASGGAIKVGHLKESSQIYFLVGDMLIVSQLLAGNFPDYQKILPKEFGTEISTTKSELLQAIRAAQIFARDNSNMVRWTIAGKTLIVLSSSPERGECRVEVPVKLEGEPLEIIFNAKYVLEFLTITKGENVTVSMGTKLSPGMFCDSERKSGKYIVMPINA